MGNRMATKLEANIRKYAGEEWISSFGEMCDPWDFL